MPFDTRIPLNANDDNLIPGCPQPVQERTGFIEMTFAIIRCESILGVRQIKQALETGRCATSVQ